MAICHDPEAIMTAETSHVHTKGGILEIHWEPPVFLLELDGFKFERCVSSGILPDESKERLLETKNNCKEGVQFHQ